MNSEILKAAQDAIREKVFPGCVIGVITANGDRLVVSSGGLAYDKGAPEVHESTIYDCASITKSIPTASLALTLMDRGKLTLDDKLITHVPEYSSNYREEVLIRHLLTYTLEGYRLSAYRDQSFEEITRLIMTKNLQQPPDTAFRYTNVSAFLLGMVVERVSGDSLDSLAGNYFFEPLGMAQTTFHPERFPIDQIAPTEVEDDGSAVRGVVHDESARVYAKAHKTVGHAGLFSCVPDLLTFMEMLLNEGKLGGRTYFSPEIIRHIYTNQIPHLDQQTGLGWELNQPRYMGKYVSESMFGKTGFTGCVVVGDIQRGVGFVILSNRTFPKRPSNPEAINRFRSRIADIVFAKSAR